MTTGTIETTYVIQAEINVNGNARSGQWGTVSLTFSDMSAAETAYEAMRNRCTEQAYRLVQTQLHVCRHGMGKVYS
jgi:hypothetical protein